MGGGEKIFLNWSEAFQAGAGKAGGKGWNLGRLDRHGFNVPAGGVLVSGIYSAYIDQNSLGDRLQELSGSISQVNAGDMGTDQELALFREEIKSGAFPPAVEGELISALKKEGLSDVPVAVRSSASLEDSGDFSFAGVHDSFLNVRGVENIIAAVKECYASLWTPGAVSYRRKMGIDDNLVLPAVVIMKMADAVASGIGFTCDPHTGRRDMILINANYGLGESVVGGSADPDRYHLTTDGFYPRITEKHIGKKEGITVAKEEGGTVFIERSGPVDGQVISDGEIVKLALHLQRIFEDLGDGERHQDVEWVFDGREFFIVQARPVTALPRYTFSVLKGQPDYWSNSNVRDAVPMVVSTLTREVIGNLIGTIVTAPFRAAGYEGLPGLRHMRLFQGRIYLNMSTLQWMFYDAFLVTPAETNESAGGYAPEIQIPPGLDAGSARRARNWRRLKLMLSILKGQRKAPKQFDRVRSQVSAWLGKDFSSMSGRSLMEAMDRISCEAAEYANTVGLLNASSGYPLIMLSGVLEKYFPGKGNIVANDLLVGRGNITSANQGYRLLEMAEAARREPGAVRYLTSEDFDPLLWEGILPGGSEFRRKLSEFIDEFGHRAVYEGDIINPRWRENPEYLLDIIRSLLDTADYGKMRKAQQEKGENTRQSVRRKVPFWRRPVISWWAGNAVRGAGLREEAKSELVRTVLPIRVIALEIGRRLVERDLLDSREDVFHCSWADLIMLMEGLWDGKSLKALVTGRKERRSRLEQLSPPDVVEDESPGYAAMNAPGGAAAPGALKGISVATGRATGTARLIFHPGQGGRLNTGEVLVAPSTDPGWTPLFLKASALVMETGGSLSHGAIVAREFGIPAVVNVPGIMNLLQDGQTVTVDGDEGKVFLPA